MEISLINTIGKVNFSARNKYIRKADDILRTSKSVFPMISPTYMDEFYYSTKENNDSEKTETAIGLKELQHFRLRLARVKAQDKKIHILRETGKIIPYTAELEGIKTSKKGNCQEKAIAVLSTLAANNFVDSQRVLLYLQTQYVNKKTGEIEYQAEDNLDHSLVITTMNRGKIEDAKEKDIIVIDPWLDFADSLSGARARFKQVFDKKSYQDITSFHRSMFRLEQMANMSKSINFEDYILRQKFIFKRADDITKKDMNDLGQESRKLYNNVLKTLQSNQSNI